MPKDSQFTPQDLDLPEVGKFALLWATKDAAWVNETKMFWVLVEMDLCMVISQRLRFSPTLYNKLEPYTEFKVDFHNISICLC